MAGATAYRRDIDGLRALAILPVLLYHARVPGLSGGFVGVDVFFVISGFLITGIIAREIDSGSFSLVQFYERRARRILPALLAVIAFVLAGAAWLYLPGDFSGVPGSALATLGFLSNVWFFSKTGYFAGGAETMPLLHGWSLAVEEQFYIVFPLLLWILARFRPGWRTAALWAILLGSLGWAWAKQADPDGFAFYMLPTRAWELMAGALLAVGAVPAVRPRAVREGLAALGLGLIVWAVLSYDRHTVFPGLAAIPPVLGAALLLHCAPGTLVGRLLSSPLPVGVGLISYSLYLWHWPLVVFTEYARDAALSGIWQIGVLAASLLAAWLSWRFIEQPFRDAKRFDRRRIFVLSGAGIGALGAASLALLTLGGWPQRFAPEVIRFDAASADFSPRRDACLSESLERERPDCTFGAAGAAPTDLVWGDSHGVELAWVLGERAVERGGAVMQRTRGSCPAAQGYAPPTDPACARFTAGVLDTALTTPGLRRVWLVGFWASEQYQTPAMARGLEQTIARLRAAGKEVILIAPIPAQPFNVPRRLARAAAWGLGTEGTSAADYRVQRAWFDAALPAWQAHGITVLDPARVLVAGERTQIVIGGVPLYFDSHHLSLAGARALIAAAP